MNEDRIQTFTEEIGELKLRGARADRERWLLVIGMYLTMPASDFHILARVASIF